MISHQEIRKPPTCQLQRNEKPVEMIIDSGASANLLCEITFQAINSQTTITTSVLPYQDVKTTFQLTSLFSEKGKKGIIRASVAFFKGSKKTNCAWTKTTMSPPRPNPMVTFSVLRGGETRSKERWRHPQSKPSKASLPQKHSFGKWNLYMVLHNMYLD